MSTRTKSKADTIKDILKEIKKFPLDVSMSVPKRMANCLVWAATACPGQFIPLNYLLQATMGYGRTPAINTKEVEQLKTRMYQVRKVLMNDYKLDMVTERGVGVRATFSSEDVAKHTLPKKVKRFENSRRSVEGTLQIVDSSKIQNKELKSWVNGLSPAFKALANSDLVKKLLPAATDKE